MKRVTGIAGVFLRAKDPKALADWYRQPRGQPRRAVAAAGGQLSTPPQVLLAQLNIHCTPKRSTRLPK
jgi:hypothetical protein